MILYPNAAEKTGPTVRPSMETWTSLDETRSVKAENPDKAWTRPIQGSEERANGTAIVASTFSLRGNSKLLGFELLGFNLNQRRKVVFSIYIFQ